ncbi:MAG: DoxX family protein [Candidatus Gracilibacteria bacterium]|nr:DoxX family protein [Candidatus Gracilibacteria bacterium]
MNNCLYKILDTRENDYGLLITRIALGVFMLVHGWGKLMNFGATIDKFEANMGIPAIVTALVIIGESIGAIVLILGFKVRFVALSMLIILVGAVLIVHTKDPFSGGTELHFIASAIALSLMINGGGAFSLDTYIKKYFAPKV